MKIILAICVLLLCIDSTLERFIFHKDPSHLIEMIGEEQQEKQEDKDGSSFTQKDKTAATFYKFSNSFLVSNSFFLYSSENNITTGFQSCLYRPPEA